MSEKLENYIRNVLPKMDGWCSPEKARAMAANIDECKPVIFVEIGVFAGRSLIAAALAMEDTGIGHLWGIDPWKTDASVQGFHDENAKWWSELDHEAIYRQCVAKIAEAGVSERITLLKMDSRQALETIPHAIDVLHIDGNHSEEQSCFDVDNYVPLVRHGGFVWFDDTDWQTTKKAQSKLAETCDVVGNTGTCFLYRKKLKLEERAPVA